MAPAQRVSLTIPRFCSGGNLLILLMLSVALAGVIALAGVSAWHDFFDQFGATALFVVWVSLSSAALLCVLSNYCSALPNAMLVTLGFLLIQVVTVVYSLLVTMAPDTLRSVSQLAMADPELFMARNLAISLIASFLIFRHWSLLDQWRTQIAAESRVRLEALQARIRPHFLFNTLNTIASLIPEQPGDAEQATMDLADLLRTGLKDEAHHSLGDELELVRGYLRIEALRLGDRLQLEWTLDRALPLDRRMPALLLQPLVENAIVHGIARMTQGGVLRIAGAVRRSGQVRFVIENPYPEKPSKSGEGSQLALENIRQRLALAFEQGGRLKTDQADGVFRATLDLPAGK